jgi:UDP-glucose 4-epimerase
MKILITGGAGFIGLHLAQRLLSQGWSVDLVDNLSRTGSDQTLERVTAEPRGRLITADLRQRDALEPFAADYDVVCHLAALVGVESVLRDAFGTLADNISLTENVIRFACRQKHLSRLLFASTSEVYAHAVAANFAPIPTPEDVALHLTSLSDTRQSYLLSKIVGEALCQHSGLPFTILRPHNVFGPRMGVAHVIPQIFQRISASPEDGVLDVFSADHTRTFCYIDDAIDLVCRVIDTPACEKKTLNIGTQTPEITIHALAETMLKIVGKRLRIVPRAPHPGSPSRRCPDMTLTDTLTGHLRRVELADALRRTYEWYQVHVFDVSPGAAPPSRAQGGAAPNYRPLL